MCEILARIGNIVNISFDVGVVDRKIKRFLFISLIVINVPSAFCEIEQKNFQGSADQSTPISSYIKSIFSLNPLHETLYYIGGLAITGTAYIKAKVFTDSFSIDNDTQDSSDTPFFDRWLLFDYSEDIDKLSDYTQYLSIALPGVLLFTDMQETFLSILVLYGESMLYSFGVKYLFKAFISRKRPYVYREDTSSELLSDQDAINSFPSGHTTMAFTSAVFTSYVFCLSNPESKFKIPFWISTLSLAGLTGALRISSGSHFLSDVIAGAAIGSFFGFLIPYLHLNRSNDKTMRGTNNGLNITLLPEGFGISVNLSF